MSDLLASTNPFLQKIIAVIEENLGDEDFGVTELADRIHMSRSNLLRKIKQETGLSVSVFIRNVRLEHAKKLLQAGSLTISEISYRVGFNSPSYFTRCFRERFGYTPGELGDQVEGPEIPAESEKMETKSDRIWVGLAGLAGIVIIAIAYFFFTKDSGRDASLSRSIAVLPFKNDSNDSTNIYIMNGLMEAILDNFQKIEDIRVTSRTTVEKYRGVAKTIPELARELNVNYFIEGSGQKIGDEILLTIQLIEAPTDRHLWSKRYRREAKDIFQLQMEVARSIASEINAVITPEENQRLEKIPTQNLVAYDYYLTGLALIKDNTGAGLPDAVDNFKKAIREDGNFANAYAYVAIAYYYLDMFLAEKKYSEEIKRYADKACLIDPESGESLTARGLYFMQIKEYAQAVEAFEDVLKYYPNNGWVHNLLSEIYNWYIPNTEKYLQHALQGLQLAVSGQDSVTASITYLHVSNALAQTGFLKEAEEYAKRSLDLNPENRYTRYLSIFLQAGQDNDFKNAKIALEKILQEDTTRVDIVQEIAKISYTLGDNNEAWKYYSKMVAIIEALQLDIYRGEYVNIGYVLEQLGRKEEAAQYYQEYYAYIQDDQSIYKDLSLSAYAAISGDKEEAIRKLKAFSEVDGYIFWLVMFIDKDPVLLTMSDHPDFYPTIKKIKDKFWVKHRELRTMLEEKGVIRPLYR